MSNPSATLPPLESAKTKHLLSPFTFNNITLPSIPQSYQSLQLKHQSPPQKDTPLSTILEKRGKARRTKKEERSKTKKEERNKIIRQKQEKAVPPSQQSKRVSSSKQGKKKQKLQQKEKEGSNKAQQSKKTIDLVKTQNNNKNQSSSKAGQNTQKIGQKTNKVVQVKKARRYSQKHSLNEKQSKLNKTIQVIKSQEMQKEETPTLIGAISDPSKIDKKIKYLNSRNNMEQYMKMNLTKSGWQQTKLSGEKEAQLLWSNADTPSDYYSIKNGQFYNHIKGSVNLTNKDLLHEQLQGMSQQFYPSSFLIAKEYEQFMQQNNGMAVKKMLRGVATEILFHFNKDKIKVDELLSYQICLGQVFQANILQNGNQQTKILVKLCMYLELLRRQNHLDDYFQHFKGYFRVSIKPKPNLFEQLIQTAAQYLDHNMDKYLQVNYQHIDYRLLVLILHYHKLFNEYDPAYPFKHYLWIVKPIASSKGAGIHILKSTSQFLCRQTSVWNQFKNQKKFQNKILQKYICNPYLIKGNSQFNQYQGRKFDIRQWVLVICNSNRIATFKYHTAYCRFSSKKFTLQRLGREIHLTNYHLYEQEQQLPSVMMLQELFAATHQDFRGKYTQQSNKIIKDTITHCHRLKYQEGCFQLFGFDFLMDSLGKLHLLQINLNPACASHRYKPLEKQTQIMAQTMLSLVTESKPSQKWIQLSGPQIGQEQNQILGGVNDINVKPFYGEGLQEQQSLIALIRYRKMLIFRIGSLVKKYFGREFMERVKEIKVSEREEGEETTEKGKITYVQQFSAVTL